MTRLGFRLATAGGPGAVVGLALTSGAVAVGTAILLFAVSFMPAVTDRDARTAWREYLVEGDGGTLVLVQEDRSPGHLITRVHVGMTSPAPARPPGLASLPEPGTAYVSPALAELMARTPADQLADRFGQVVGAVPDVALGAPDELIAVVGTDPAVLRALGAMEIERFATDPAPLDLPPIAALIVILAAVGAIAPVGVFVATATRLTAARRELRLAALRLVGATPAQIARLAVVEALISTMIGAAGGLVLFLAVRPAVARIPLDGLTWWPETIVPPLPAMLVLLGAVQLVGTVAALASMRRLTITPLGVQRRAAAPGPGAVRVIPLLVAVVALAGAVRWYRADPDVASLAGAGLAFAGVVFGIALVGPWLTALVGRALLRVANGGATLLAARRINQEPRASFGAIAGVILAVFVASAFFTFTAYAERQSGTPDPLLRDGSVAAYVAGPANLAGALGERLASVEGIGPVVAVREVALLSGDVQTYGWVVSCPDLAARVGLDPNGCARGGVTVLDPATPAATYTLLSAAPITESTPPASISIPAATAHPALTTDHTISAHLPPVLIDPGAVDGAVELLPVTRLYARTDGTPEALERLRTAVTSAIPTASLRTAGEAGTGGETYAEIGRIVGLGLVGTLALAGCSLAVAVTTATLERRRAFVLLRSAGMPASALRWTVLLQAAAPLLVVAGFSAALGVVVGTLVLGVAGADGLTLPDPSLLVTLVVSLGVAMAIVALTLPPLERMTRPLSLRHE